MALGLIHDIKIKRSQIALLGGGRAIFAKKTADFDHMTNSESIEVRILFVRGTSNKRMGAIW